MNFSTDDIPDITDVVETSGNSMDGDKTSIDSILNIPLVFLAWEIRRSKFKKDGAESQFLTLQFKQDDVLKSFSQARTC